MKNMIDANKNKILLATIFIFTSYAHASYGVLTAKEAYCRVEIRKGPHTTADPSTMPTLVYSGSVTAGMQFQGAEGERLCFRRSATPLDCQSPLSQWACVSPGGVDSEQGQPKTDSF